MADVWFGDAPDYEPVRCATCQQTVAVALHVPDGHEVVADHLDDHLHSLDHRPARPALRVVVA